MKISSKVMPLVFFMSALSAPTLAAAGTNRGEMKRSRAQGWDGIIWSEIGHADYLELSAAIAATVASYGAASPYILTVLKKKLWEVAQRTATELGEQLAVRLLKDLILNDRGSSLMKGRVKFEVGHAAFNHWTHVAHDVRLFKCDCGCGKYREKLHYVALPTGVCRNCNHGQHRHRWRPKAIKRKVPLPNTHGFFLRWRYSKPAKPAQHQAQSSSRYSVCVYNKAGQDVVANVLWMGACSDSTYRLRAGESRMFYCPKRPQRSPSLKLQWTGYQAETFNFDRMMMNQCAHRNSLRINPSKFGHKWSVSYGQ